MATTIEKDIEDIKSTDIKIAYATVIKDSLCSFTINSFFYEIQLVLSASFQCKKAKHTFNFENSQEPYTKHKSSYCILIL